MAVDYPPASEHGLTTPFGLLRYAEEYRLAAELVRHNESLVMPAYMLLGHCYEVALKAFLLARGMEIRELSSRPYGHNLDELWAEALRRRIDRLYAMSAIAGEVIATLNRHFATHEFRYIRTGTKTVPRWDFAGPIAKNLTHGLHDYCLRKRIGRDAAKRRIALRSRFSYPEGEE